MNQYFFYFNNIFILFNLIALTFFFEIEIFGFACENLSKFIKLSWAKMTGLCNELCVDRSDDGSALDNLRLISFQCISESHSTSIVLAHSRRSRLIT